MTTAVKTQFLITLWAGHLRNIGGLWKVMELQPFRRVFKFLCITRGVCVCVCVCVCMYVVCVYVCGGCGMCVCVWYVCGACVCLCVCVLCVYVVCVCVYVCVLCVCMGVCVRERETYGGSQTTCQSYSERTLPTEFLHLPSCFVCVFF